MSCVAIHVEPQRALIGCDTDAIGRGHAEGSAELTVRHQPVLKLFPLSHVPAVLTGRGHGLWISAVASFLALMPPDFDGIVEHLPAVFPRLTQSLTGIPDFAEQAYEPQQIFLVGWSQQRGQVVGYRFDIEGGECAGAVEFNGTVAAPWDGEFGALWIPNTPEAMAGMLRHQVRTLKARMGEKVAAGGDLTIAELTRDTIHVSKIAEADTVQIGGRSGIAASVAIGGNYGL